MCITLMEMRHATEPVFNYESPLSIASFQIGNRLIISSGVPEIKRASLRSGDLLNYLEETFQISSEYRRESKIDATIRITFFSLTPRQII